MTDFNAPSMKDLGISIEKLPLLPVVMTQLLSLNENDPDFYEALIGLARTDPPLSAMILKMANSAAYAVGANVNTIESATMRIGTQAIMESIRLSGLNSVLEAKTNHQKGLWRHSIRAAVIARLIARKSTSFKMNPNQLYLSALMHDIGSFIIMQLVPGSIDSIENQGWQINNEKVDVERSMLGYDHSEIGYLVCKHWGFSEELASVVKLHHMSDIMEKEHLTMEFRRQLLVVQFSDYVSSFMENNQEWCDWDAEMLAEHIENECQYPVWDILKVRVLDVAEQLYTVKTEIDSIFDVMGIE